MRKRSQIKEISKSHVLMALWVSYFLLLGCQHGTGLVEEMPADEDDIEEARPAKNANDIFFDDEEDLLKTEVNQGMETLHFLAVAEEEFTNNDSNQTQPLENQENELDQNFDNAAEVKDSKKDDKAKEKKEEPKPKVAKKDEPIDVDVPSDFTPISLDFKAASLREVIRAISNETQINFILPERISNQRIYVSLKDVPWDNALRAILDTNGLGMIRMSGNVIRIDSLSVLDREHQDVEGQRKKAALSTPTKVLVVRLSYSKATKLLPIVKEMLPSASYDKRVIVQADDRTNSIVVEAIPQELTKIRSLIERMDMQTPQVKIESRVIEVQKSTNSFLGINWGAPLNYDQGRGLGFGNLVFPNNFISAFSVDTGAMSNTPADGKFDIHVGSLNNVTALDLRLRMGELTNQVKSLQNNNVLVVDGETANIEAGQEDFFQVPTGNGQTSLSSVKYTLSLKVTPHIAADGSVQMSIEVENSEPTKPASGVATSKSLRTLHTNMMRKTGETAVIGGLYTTQLTEQKEGFPILMDLPILGFLFRSSAKGEKRRELIILVTPTIVTYNDREKVAMKTFATVKDREKDEFRNEDQQVNANAQSAPENAMKIEMDRTSNESVANPAEKTDATGKAQTPNQGK